MKPNYDNWEGITKDIKKISKWINDMQKQGGDINTKAKGARKKAAAKKRVKKKVELVWVICPACECSVQIKSNHKEIVTCTNCNIQFRVSTSHDLQS